VTAPTTTPRRITARHIQKMLLEERDAAKAVVAARAVEYIAAVPGNELQPQDRDYPLAVAVWQLDAAQRRLDAATGIAR
jgi:hypothetical protein